MLRIIVEFNSVVINNSKVKWGLNSHEIVVAAVNLFIVPKLSKKMVHQPRHGDAHAGPQNRGPFFSLLVLLVLWLLVSDPGQEMVSYCLSQATSWGIGVGILTVVPPKGQSGAGGSGSDWAAGAATRSTGLEDGGEEEEEEEFSEEEMNGTSERMELDNCYLLLLADPQAVILKWIVM